MPFGGVKNHKIGNNSANMPIWSKKELAKPENKLVQPFYNSFEALYIVERFFI